MSNLQQLAKLRQFTSDMDVTDYLTGEHRQNLQAIEASIKSISSTGSSILTGEMKIWPGMRLPTGYLWCDGTSYDVSKYPNLAKALYDDSTQSYAWGGNSSTFNVPDTRGLALRGVDGAANRDPDNASRTAMATGGNAGNKVGSYQADELKSHTHSVQLWGNSAIASNFAASTGFPGLVGAENTLATGGNETRMKNAYVNYIIKY